MPRLLTPKAVPKPLPGVFRITKNIHNVLQGVSHPDQRITAGEKDAIIDWITENAHRYWLSDGGPLRPVEEGGAHVVIVSIFSDSAPDLVLYSSGAASFLSLAPPTHQYYLLPQLALTI